MSKQLAMGRKEIDVKKVMRVMTSQRGVLTPWELAWRTAVVATRCEESELRDRGGCRGQDRMGC